MDDSPAQRANLRRDMQASNYRRRRPQLGPMSFDTVRLGPLAHEPLDPGAQCDGCGTTGTVAVTVLHSTPEQVWRYCEACWPAARDRWETEREEETLDWMRKTMRAGPFDRGAKPPGSSVGSRSWHDVGIFIERYLFRPDGSPAAELNDLASIAREIRTDAPKMHGPMPAKIAAFVEKYSRAAT
jgi:hypothetical protein